MASKCHIYIYIYKQAKKIPQFTVCDHLLEATPENQHLHLRSVAFRRSARCNIGHHTASWNPTHHGREHQTCLQRSDRTLCLSPCAAVHSMQRVNGDVKLSRDVMVLVGYGE